MKLLFLPPKPLLTKKGTPRKRGPRRSPGRVFLEDGSELEGLATVSIASEPLAFDVTTINDLRAGRRAEKPAGHAVTHLTLEFVNPQVEIVDQVPAPQKAAKRR
ncbi:MAG TPA: hypothetical protein VEA35_13510 [Ramlibacter sp.]|nr:hypothetical protein [Candidatus Limnocylindrales bacterium]HYF43443.1 hypothetical protein [Ramlibacter sp.]